MSNLASFMEKYNIKPRDYGNNTIKDNTKNIRILESSLQIEEIEYYNNDPSELITPNKATEIIALGYYFNELPNHTIHIPREKTTYKEFQCFITRTVFHGSLKRTNITERDILHIITNRFAYNKAKFDVRLMDFSFSNFFTFFIGQCPTELVQYILDNEGYDQIENYQLKNILENTNLSEDLRCRLGMLLELTGN